MPTRAVVYAKLIRMGLQVPALGSRLYQRVPAMPRRSSTDGVANGDY